MTDTRTNEQNKLLWAMLSDVSQQVTWHGLKYSKEDWKQIFSACVFGTKMVQSIDGSGVIMFPKSTSRVKKMADEEGPGFDTLLTTIEVFGVEQGVKFTAPKFYEGY